MYVYFEQCTTWHRGLVASVLDFGTRGPGSFPAGHLLQIVFFFFFNLVMQNHFIQVISNYINDKRQKIHSLMFYIELALNFLAVGLNLVLLKDN